MKDINLTGRIDELLSKSKNLGEILDAPVSPYTQEEKLLSILKVSDEGKTDIAFAGLTIGDFIYDALRVDPMVIEAVDFARAEDVGNIFKFAVYSDILEDLSITTLEGNIHNLKGYVAERFVAQELQSEGMEVEFPKDPNQEGFDLLVNGDPFQVKCLADQTGVLEHIERFPNIPVLINEELANSLEDVPNVYPVPGLTNEGIETATRDSIEAGEEILDYEIPFIAISVAIGKNVFSILNGKTDLKHGSINVAYDVAGGIAGGELGSSGLALCGSLLGPYGTIVGGITGAIIGSMYGRRIVSKIKRKIHTLKEEERAESALREFVRKSYVSSKKSQKIFEKKAKLLLDGLLEKGNDMEFLTNYVKKRLNHERRYLKDKIQQLSKFRKYPRSIDPQTNDILVAGINAITLSLRAKVHPYSVKEPMDDLMDSLKTVQEKKAKL